MRVHKSIPAPALAAAVSVMALLPSEASAYVGPGPGMEMIPYFMSLLVWAGVAMGGVLLWPISALLSRFRKPRPEAQDATKSPPS